MTTTAPPIELDRWRSPASAYPRATHGRARIATKWYPPGYYNCYMQRGFEFFNATARLYITDLEIAGDVWMVDDPPHWWAMQGHAEALEGHVLCAGLGLGLIVHALDANPNVERITVVERERDVIDLVGPQVPNDKLDIVHADFFDADLTWPGPYVDGVLFDLFVGDARDLFGGAIRAATYCLRKWGEEITVRVHGFPNPMIEDYARSILAVAS